MVRNSIIKTNVPITTIKLLNIKLISYYIN